MNQSIIEHKANMYYVEFREDYLHICQQATYTKPTKDNKKSKASPHCKALILAILEHWTNDKRGKSGDLYVYMTYAEWGKSMYEMFGRSVIIDSLDELIGEGLISAEPCTRQGHKSFKYLLNTTEINKRMRGLEDRDPRVIHPQVDASTSKPQTTSINRPQQRLQVNPAASTSKRNIESNNRDSDHIDSKRENTPSPVSPLPKSQTARPQEIVSLCEKELEIAILPAPSVWQAVKKMIDAQATDEMIKAVIARMLSLPYWGGCITIENVGNNFSREWSIIQQQRRKKPTPLSALVPDTTRTMSQEGLEAMRARVNQKKAAQ